MVRNPFGMTVNNSLKILREKLLILSVNSLAQSINNSPQKKAGRSILAAQQ
jgi:hypothetical protein